MSGGMAAPPASAIPSHVRPSAPPPPCTPWYPHRGFSFKRGSRGEISNHLPIHEAPVVAGLGSAPGWTTTTGLGIRSTPYVCDKQQLRPSETIWALPRVICDRKCRGAIQAEGRGGRLGGL